MKEVVSLFIAFAKVGALGFGGGHSMIPLIQVEVVDRYRWLNIEEFTDALAMANSLPGPITTKISLLVGHKVAGLAGGGISVAGLLLPSSIMMIVLATLYVRYKDLPAVKGMLIGVRPVVVALLFMVIYDIFPSSVTSWHTALLAVISFCAIVFFNVHPALFIAGAALFGIVFYR